MGKMKTESKRWTIPSDWDEETDGFLCYMLCVPDSRQWRTIVDGQISSLAYGRNWNLFSGIITDAQIIGQEVFESMCAAKCDDILLALQCICETNTKIANKTDDTGQEIEGETSAGEITTGPGEQFPDQDAYFNAKCSVANGIYDTVLGMTSWLDDNESDVVAGSFGGVTSGILTGISIIGVFGWVWTKVVSFVVSVAGLMISNVTSYSDLAAALIDTHEECVRVLFNAADAVTAENNFVAAVEAGTPAIGPVEEQLLRVMITNDLVNELFSPREDSATYESPDPIDCDTFSIQTWTFDTSGQGWIFEDTSPGSNTTSGQWVSAREAWEIRLIGTSGGGGATVGRVYLDSLAIGVSEINSVRADYSATSGGLNISIVVLVTFSDLTTATNHNGGNTPGPGTVIVNIPSTKTIEEISVQASRQAGTYDFTVDIEEVRVQ